MPKPQKLTNIQYHDAFTALLEFVKKEQLIDDESWSSFTGIKQLLDNRDTEYVQTHIFSDCDRQTRTKIMREVAHRLKKDQEPPLHLLEDIDVKKHRTETDRFTSHTSRGRTMHRSASKDQVCDVYQDKKFKKSPILRYCDEVQQAFLYNLNSSDRLQDVDSYSVEEILYDEKALIELHTGFSDLNSPEVIIQRYKWMISDLRDSISSKLFVAAADKEILKHYFPDWEKYFDLLHKASMRVASEIYEYFPEFKVVQGRYYNYELGHVFGALVEEYKEVDQWWEILAEEASKKLELLIRQWKGRTFQGLAIITRLVHDHEYTYGDKPRDRSMTWFLDKVLEGYSEPVNSIIRPWYREVILSQPELTPEIMFEEFIDNFWPKLPHSSLRHQKSMPTVSEPLYGQYKELLSLHECEDDFYEVREGPNMSASQNNIKKLKDRTIRRKNIYMSRRFKKGLEQSGIPMMFFEKGQQDPEFLASISRMALQ